MKPYILAIDPGPEESAYVRYSADNGHLADYGKVANDPLRQRLRSDMSWRPTNTLLVIEMIASYGMPVGREVFDTCRWVGRFEEAWAHGTALFYRKDVKLILCGSVRATDKNIRAELINRYGGQAVAVGTKKAPGPLYGVKKDVWAALALAKAFALEHGHEQERVRRIEEGSKAFG